MKTIHITIEAEHRELLALATFLRRSGPATIELLVDPTKPEEAQEMFEGLCALRRGMRETGYLR